MHSGTACRPAQLTRKRRETGAAERISVARTQVENCAVDGVCTEEEQTPAVLQKEDAFSLSLSLSLSGPKGKCVH
jgi:hypothetical protein